MTLRDYADRIPDLGAGGKSCGDKLIRHAAAVKNGQAIVDIAPFLGSTSAYLALGIIQGCNGVDLHAFDLWEADAHYCRMAKKYCGVELTEGEDLEIRWRKNMRPFEGVYHFPHKGDVQEAEWKGPEIGLLVDDISNGPGMMDHTMATFGPWMPPGSVLVLMDWQFKSDGEYLLEQRRWMEYHPDAFKLMDLFPLPSVGAAFVRMKGAVT